MPSVFQLKEGVNEIPPGVFSPWGDLRVRKNLVIKAKERRKTIISGNHFGFLITDGSDSNEFAGLVFEKCWRGPYLRGVKNTIIRDCEMRYCRMEGGTNGGGDKVSWIDCVSYGHGPNSGAGSWSGTGRWGSMPHSGQAHACHAYYAGTDNQNTSFVRCIGHDVPGVGLKVNGDPNEGGYTTGLDVDGMILYRCGSQGTPGIDIAEVDGGEIHNLLSHNNRGIMNVWGDMRSDRGSRNIEFHRSTFWDGIGVFNLQFGGRAREISYEECIIVGDPNKPLVSFTEGGGGLGSKIELNGCYLLQRHANDPNVVYSNCKFFQNLDEAAAFFADVSQGDFRINNPALKVGWFPWDEVITPPPPPVEPIEDERDKEIKRLSLENAGLKGKMDRVREIVSL